MRKGSVQLTFDNFEGWLTRYERLISRIISARRIIATDPDKKELLEAFTFKIVALWEVFVEDLMVDCLNRDTSQYSRYMELRLAKHLPRQVCRAMITGLGYTNFRGVSDIKKTAQNILVTTCNPFKAIPHHEGELIDEFTKMRNYIAHYSVTARRSLMNSYKTNHKLTRFRDPADYLYANNRKTGYIRFADYTTAFRVASNSMRRAIKV